MSEWPSILRVDFIVNLPKVVWRKEGDEVEVEEEEGRVREEEGMEGRKGGEGKSDCE